MGYLSTNMLSRYLSVKCGYKLNETEVPLILARYDKDGDYRISKEEFTQEVEAKEEEDYGGEEEIPNGDYE